MDNRTWVIGDIHGANRALLQILEKIDPQPTDQFIFLGDYVDGWSESMQVVNRLIDLNTKHACTFIKGNHDVWCEEWLKNGIPDPIWQTNGGIATMRSYDDTNEQLRIPHRDFFCNLSNYFIDTNNRLFIHAGYASMHGPARETYTSNYNWDRTLLETALAMDKNLTSESPFYPKRLKLFAEIFIGHTPTINFGIETPIHAANVWAVDTGAGFNGKLTAIELNTQQFVQSDLVTSLYPNEKGRNK